jgi:hypothetical protein
MQVTASAVSVTRRLKRTNQVSNVTQEKTVPTFLMAIVSLLIF